MHTTLEFGAHITQHNIHMFICLLYVIQQKYMETDRQRSARKKERKNKQQREREVEKRKDATMPLLYFILLYCSCCNCYI